MFLHLLLLVQLRHTLVRFYLKELWHVCLVDFVNIANYASLCAMELNFSEEITCKWQNHSFLFNKYTSQASYQTLQTTKINFEKW